jgi:chorismate-pyruvate lyase
MNLNRQHQTFRSISPPSALALQQRFLLKLEKNPYGGRLATGRNRNKRETLEMWKIF